MLQFDSSGSTSHLGISYDKRTVCEQEKLYREMSAYAEL
jgi:hypothetical protein